MTRGPARQHAPHGNHATPSADPARCLEIALARRAPLLADPDTNVARLFNSAADGIDGLVIERLGDVLVVQMHEGRLTLAEDVLRTLCASVAERLKARAVYRKVYPQQRSALSPELEKLHHDSTPWLGEPVEPELPVVESGMRFLVRPYDGYLMGLFLDHRASRARVRELAAGRRVLNTFAYTCGFTLAAALGGAALTVSVDVSKKSLEWGRRNLAANGLALDTHRFVCSDVFDYYRRAARQGRRFDFIILDPPTFARSKQTKRPFALTEQLAPLVSGAVDLLDSGGIIHLSVNHRETSVRQLEHAVTAATRECGRHCTALDRPPLPDDFHGDPDYAKSVLWRVD